MYHEKVIEGEVETASPDPTHAANLCTRLPPNLVQFEKPPDMVCSQSS